MKKLIATFAFLILAVSFAAAQTHITGKVTSAGDNKPIANATVKAKGTNVTVTTNATGDFSIDAPANTTELICGCNGYVTQTKSIKASTINFTLEKKITQSQTTPTKNK